MARIRSIKPDFFTSEVIASLPISARLTFIGLWTHVDDNGVTVDNARLIAAAIWPLEEDPRETFQRLREDLRRLHEALLIARYEVAGKRYLFVSNWDEHQKVSHPKKTRYPRPGGDGCTLLTSENADPRENLRESSGELPEDRAKAPETLRPEQGAGSREQGVPPSAAEPPAPASRTIVPIHELTITQRSKVITDAYHHVEPMCKWPAINAIVIKAIKAGRWSDDEIQAALLRLAREGRPVTVDTLRFEMDGLPPSSALVRAGTNGHQQPYVGTSDRKVAQVDVAFESFKAKLENGGAL